LSYFLRFAASCSFVVLSTLRCLMQRCRTFFCASLLHAALSCSLLSALRSLMQRCHTSCCASQLYTALSYYLS
jgi:hypothetical protein